MLTAIEVLSLATLHNYSVLPIAVITRKLSCAFDILQHNPHHSFSEEDYVGEYDLCIAVSPLNVYLEKSCKHAICD